MQNIQTGWNSYSVKTGQRKPWPFRCLFERLVPIWTFYYSWHQRGFTLSHHHFPFFHFLPPFLQPNQQISQQALKPEEVGIKLTFITCQSNCGVTQEHNPTLGESCPLGHPGVGKEIKGTIKAPFKVKTFSSTKALPMVCRWSPGGLAGDRCWCQQQWDSKGLCLCSQPPTRLCHRAGHCSWGAANSNNYKSSSVPDTGRRKKIFNCGVFWLCIGKLV